MRWNLWLALPETERSLAAILRIAVAAVAVWTLAAGYGVWSSRAALATAHASVVSQTKKILLITQDLPVKRREARKADEVEPVSSQGAGSAEITVELADLARVAGAQARGVRIGDGGKTAAPAAKTAPAPAGDAQTPAAKDPAATPASDATQESFECNVSGDYPAITRFLSDLAASRHVLDITALEVTQDDAKAQTASPHLDMKISGSIDETAEKS